MSEFSKMTTWVMEKIKSNVASTVLVTLSWGIGFTMLFKTIVQFNLESPEKIHQNHLIFLFTSLGLIFLPFLKSIKIGNWLELSREVKETKEEVKAFKQEIRQTVSMLSNTVNASIRQQVQVNLNLPDTKKIMKGETEI
jgi:hypothetical protein